MKKQMGNFISSIINKKRYKIILFILLAVSLIILFFNIYYNNKENFESNNNFTAITYDNSATPTNTDNLEKLFEKKGYNYKIVGKNKKWNGWYGRVKEYLSILDDIYEYNDNQYILLCDGRDVLINGDYENFIKKAIELYNKNDKKIIFGSERHCCSGNSGINSDDVYKKYMEDIAVDKTTYNYYYLNFGLIFGNVKDIKNLFETMNIQPGDTDQSLAVVEFCKNPDKYTLDYDQELFCNNSGECNLKWDDNKKKFKHTITNTYPSILHFPGGNWDCYKDCAEKIFIDMDTDFKFYNQ